MMLKKLPSFI